jgi:hypothetical protein
VDITKQLKHSSRKKETPKLFVSVNVNQTFHFDNKITEKQATMHCRIIWAK